MTFRKLYTSSFFKKISIIFVCIIYTFTLIGFSAATAELSRADLIKSIITKRNQVRLSQENLQEFHVRNEINEVIEYTKEDIWTVDSRNKITDNNHIEEDKHIGDEEHHEHEHTSYVYGHPLIYVPQEPIPAVHNNCYDIQEVEIIPYMYHYVREAHRDPAHTGIRNNSILPSTARSQFAYLADLQKNTDTGIIFMSELTDYQESNCFPHKQNVILVFDDGRRDNYNFLLPLAQEYGIKVNIGIIVNRISRGERIDPFMTGQEIQTLIDSGRFEVQSHSRSHGNLANMNRNTQRKEICDSKTWIEDTFGIDVETFVYPMGLYNHISIEIASQCGYKNALTTHTWNESIHNELSRHPFELSRIRTQRWSTGGSLFGG